MAITVDVSETSALGAERLAGVRALCDAAFDLFEDADWEHALGGHHVIALDEGAVVAHAAVVARTLLVGSVAVRVGYVEAVATHPDRQGEGLGSLVMTRVADLVVEHYELGGLSTGEHSFYERLGWERWRGPTFVRQPDGTEVRTEDEDDGVMVLRTPSTSTFDLTASITCEARPGDDW